jgi:hypothetical protein
MVLRIDLPDEGAISVNAELVYVRPDFGYAVRFVNVDEHTDARLSRTRECVVDSANRQPCGHPALLKSSAAIDVPDGVLGLIP